MTCNECPICMDDITETNCVVTECGHHFHTSCLMKNAAHNGFGCPYCRSVLAEVPEEDESEEEEEEEEEELYSDASLTSMRMLFSRVQNEEVEEEPEEEEEEEEEYPIPTPEVIEQKLLEQGVTMLDMIKCVLAINHEEYESEDEYQTKEDEVFGKMSIIISNYREPIVLEPVLQPLEPLEEQEEEPLPVQRLIPFPYWSEVLTFTIDKDEQLDFKSQPKERTKRNHRQQDIREEDDHIEIVIVV